MIDVTTMTRREARELTEKAVKTLHDAYRATVDQGPAATVKASIEAQGEDMTRYALYQIVNVHSHDGRISPRNRRKAAAVQTYPEYAGDTIHMAHVDQLMSALPD